MRTNMK
jgi:hypothetical protein